MKSIKLLFLALLLSATSFSQKYYKVYKSKYQSYEYNRWVDGETYYPENMFVIMDGNKITINANNTRTYMTYGNATKDVYSTHTCYTWNCVDPEGRSCSFMIKNSENQRGNVVIICYSDYALQYFTE